MMYVAVVILTVMGSATFQMNDTASDGYPTLEGCYTRIAVMIRNVAMAAPVINAQGICMEKKLGQQL
jgi:hypothetical protein